MVNVNPMAVSTEISTPDPVPGDSLNNPSNSAPLSNAPSRSISRALTRPCIGFLADFTYSEYTSRLFTGVLDAAEKLGYAVQRFRLSITESSEETFKRCMEENLVGVISHDPHFRIPMQHLDKELGSHHLPYVLLHVCGLRGITPGISSDDELGMREAIRHLAALGHQQIMLCSGQKDEGSSIARFAGYETGMGENGLESYMNAVWTEWNEEKFEAQIVAAFQSPSPPTALICCSDAMALTAIRNFHEMGIRVPRDISVVGFGNLLRTDYASPALTTVNVPYEQMGREAVKMLFDEEERFQGSRAQWKLLPTQLMVRKSTAEPAY